MREKRAGESRFAYQKMVDIHEIAKNGKSIEDGMGSERCLNRFDDLIFLPAQLATFPLNADEEVDLETTIGEDAKKPLKLKLPFLFSGMSFGAVSREVKIALAAAGKELGTASNSGEGGMLDKEREEADNYIIQLASGRFGQTEEKLKQADAIEIKISQSAKPAQGGFLPGKKVTNEIADVRGLEKGEDAHSPARHKDINSAEDLKQKVLELRDLSDGVPIGIKFTGGHTEKDLDVIIKAEPDYIVLDGFGGGTGAAGKYVKDHVSLPHPAFLVRAKNYLATKKLNRKISIIAAGGFRTSADIAKALALGADAVYLASAALMALGCEQYRLCHLGTCPTSIATQDENMRKAFKVDERSAKLVNFGKVLKKEIEDYGRIVGKNNIHNLDETDLVALSKEAAASAKVKFMSDA